MGTRLTELGEEGGGGSTMSRPIRHEDLDQEAQHRGGLKDI
jgi:hypothetical protein